MREPPIGTTSIKVKSASMLAQMIAWTQDEFYPDPGATWEPRPVVRMPHERPSCETIATLNFMKLDDENDWTEI